MVLTKPLIVLKLPSRQINPVFSRGVFWKVRDKPNSKKEVSKMEGQWQQVLCRVRKVVFDLVGMMGKPLDQVMGKQYDCLLIEYDLPVALEGIRNIPGYSKSLCQVEPDLGNMNTLATTLRKHAETLTSGGRSLGMTKDVVKVLCVVSSVPKFREYGVSYVVEVFSKPVTTLSKLSLFPSPL